MPRRLHTCRKLNRNKKIEESSAENMIENESKNVDKELDVKSNEATNPELTENHSSIKRKHDEVKIWKV